jgi:hypothetical protein
MNIFFLDKNPNVAAYKQCDKHVVKMVLETAQMLSTAARRHGKDLGYKSAYPNHPMTLWVGDNLDNYVWTVEHGIALSIQYTTRFGKTHKSESVIRELDVFWGDSSKITTPPLCMPDEFKQDDFVKAYKKYYVHKLSSWKIPPRWRLHEPDGIAVC